MALDEGADRVVVRRRPAVVRSVRCCSASATTRRLITPARASAPGIAAYSSALRAMRASPFADVDQQIERVVFDRQLGRAEAPFRVGQRRGGRGRGDVGVSSAT